MTTTRSLHLPELARIHNIAEIVVHPERDLPVLSRIPECVRTHLNSNAQERALYSAGCELRFRLLGPEVSFRLKACQVGVSDFGGGLAQVLFGDFCRCYVPVELDVPVTRTVKAPDYVSLEMASTGQRQFHPRLVRLMLPTHASICEIEVDGDIAAPEPSDCPARRLLIYGSSITQGSGSLSARESWAGQCALLLGADLINLGFGGGCHCETEMTDYLCQRDDFDIAILETGINMLGLDVAEADGRIEALIRRFSAAHADKPVFCVGVFPCRNDVDTNFGGRAEAIRRVVRRVVADINAPNLHFIEGREALTLATGLLEDLIHPSPTGMIEISRFIASRIHSVLSRSTTRRGALVSCGISS